MSKPPLFPQQSASGIAVDPRTLDRVIPESMRPDGSVRKQIKIRPGFTPQEDISRFRGTRQQAMDATALPKGQILGWVASSSEQKAKAAGTPPPNKNAKKRANQRARKAAEKSEAVKDSWEDEEDAESSGTGAQAATTPTTAAPNEDKPNRAVTREPSQGEAEVTEKLSKLKVK